MMQKPKNGKTILIVEDSPDFQYLLRQLLEWEGYELICKNNGSEALEFLITESSLPNLILLDVMMPVMDGVEFKKHQEADERLATIPVVVMTAHGHWFGSQPEISANDYIRKPAEMASVLEVVRRNVS